MKTSTTRYKAKITPRQAVTHKNLTERKGPFRNLIEIPGMKGRTLNRVEIFTTTEYHSLTLDFKDQTSLNSCHRSLLLRQRQPL